MLRLENVTIGARTNDLSGLRYLPEGERKDVAVIMAHGFTSGKYSMDNLASFLAARGFETLTFDFVGHKLGGSGGVMESMAQAPGNLSDALSWLRGVTRASRIVLLGHSMGAAAALVTAAWEVSERASPTLMGKPGAGVASGAPLAGVISLCMGVEPSSGFDSALGRAMLDQRRDYVAGAPAIDLLREIEGLIESVPLIGALPALFIAGRQDVLVSVERVERLARTAPNSTVEVIESSHLEAPDRSRSTVLNWLLRI
jgi:pimeloyl-ACP methyl ester carboxylesterase